MRYDGRVRPETRRIEPIEVRKTRNRDSTEARGGGKCVDAIRQDSSKFHGWGYLVDRGAESCAQKGWEESSYNITCRYPADSPSDT